MTEKRFEYNHVEGFQPFIYDVNDNHMVDDLEIICELLNELNDENGQLKQREKTLEGMIRTFDEGCKEIYDDKCRLEEENEQLKDALNQRTEQCDKYYEENEQLKQQIKIFEKFLEVNDLDIDWVEFCGVDECAFENPDFSCQECIHLKGDVE